MKMKLLLLIIIFLCLNSLLTAQINWNKILIENDLRNIQNRVLINDSINSNNDNFLIQKISEILSESKILLDSVLNQEYYDEDYWSTKSRTWFEYDEEGKMIRRNFQSNSPTATLNYYTFLYNEKKQIVAWDLKWYRPSYDTTINRIKYLISYDELNRGVDSIIQKWDDNLQDWVDNEKRVLKYDSTGKLENITWYKWVDNEWKNLVRTIYIYENNNLIEETYQEWYSYWYSENSYFNKYNLFGHKISSDYYQMIGGIWTWMWHYKYYYTINLVNKIESYEVNTDSSFIFRAIHKYNYNDKELIIEKCNISVYGQLEVNGNRYIYNYNDDNNLSDIEIQTWKDDKWERGYRTVYLYKEKTDVSEENQLENNIFVYPNPSSNQITIYNLNHRVNPMVQDICTIEIYNLIGIKQFEYDIELNTDENSIAIDVSSFSTGVYYIVLNNGIEVKKAMFVKE